MSHEWQQLPSTTERKVSRMVVPGGHIYEFQIQVEELNRSGQTNGYEWKVNHVFVPDTKATP